MQMEGATQVDGHEALAQAEALDEPDGELSPYSQAEQAVPTPPAEKVFTGHEVHTPDEMNWPAEHVRVVKVGVGVCDIECG
jgi:hypothetical protein